jgi:hypothetical protein
MRTARNGRERLTCATLAFSIALAWMFCWPAYGQENCEVPRVDYVKSCGDNVACLNDNFRKIKREIAVRLGSHAAHSLQKTYEFEEQYRKSFCRAILNEFEDSWKSDGPGPPADPKHAREMIAATCNVKLLADFLYGLQGGLYCSEE